MPFGPCRAAAAGIGSATFRCRSIPTMSIRPKALFFACSLVSVCAYVQHTIAHLHDIGIAVPFGLNAAQDLHDPTQMIAHLTAGGLGMPDRDYYLKPEARFAEARGKYQVHVAKMFELAGAKLATAKA